jgi:hypothetical protein
MLAVCVDRSEVYACVTHPSYKALGHGCFSDSTRALGASDEAARNCAGLIASSCLLILLLEICEWIVDCIFD